MKNTIHYRYCVIRLRYTVRRCCNKSVTAYQRLQTELSGSLTWQTSLATPKGALFEIAGTEFIVLHQLHITLQRRCTIQYC